MKLSKADFVEIVNHLKDNEDMCFDLDNVFYKYHHNDFCSGFSYSNLYIETDLKNLLTLIMNDVDKLIIWWMEDANFGRNCPSVYLDDKDYEIKTPEELYDFIEFYYKEIHHVEN